MISECGPKLFLSRLSLADESAVGISQQPLPSSFSRQTVPIGAALPHLKQTFTLR